MANGQSQTDSVGSGDEKELNKINEQSSKKKNIPESVFDDSGIVSYLQEIYPKYKGWNTARLRSELLKNEDLLDEFANKIMSDTMEMDGDLSATYQEEPELYQTHKRQIIDGLESQLSNDTLKGETTKQSIVNRTIDLRKNDLTQFKPQKQEFEYESLVNSESKKHGIDPDLIMSMIEQESGFRHEGIESNKGAIGYMQLMPDTAKELGVDPYDPEENIKGGIQYFANRVEEFEDVELALASYNAGPGAVKKAGGIPQFKETLGYVESIVGNYQKRKKKGGINLNLPMSQYKKIAESNPDKYRELGIVDEEGRFKYEGEFGAKTFATKIDNNDDLHRALEGDRYELFTEELAKMHNTGAVDEGNVDDMAKSWAIYDQFGSEGLTRYLNVEEHYQKGVPLEEQDSSVREGIEYLKNSSQNGFKPGDYVRAFFGSEDSSIGRFEVTPVTQSMEMEEEIRHDLNNWTKSWEVAENSDEGLENIVEISKKRQNQKDLSFGQQVQVAFQSPNPTTSKGLFKPMFTAVSEAVGGLMQTAPYTEYEWSDENTQLFGPNLVVHKGEETRKTTYDNATKEQIAYDLANGLDTKLAQAAKIDILREAQEQDGAFSVNDLARTIMANAEYSEKEGSPLYKVDYKNASPEVRTAIDVFRFDEEMSKSFYRAKDGDIIFEPNYLGRVAKKALPKYATSLNWEKQVVADPDGNPIGYTMVQGEQGIWESLGNTITSIGYESAKFIDDYAIKPMIEKGLMGLMDDMAENFDSDEIRQYKNAIEAGYASTWRENLDTDIRQQMEFDGAGDLLPTIGAWGTSFAAYLFTASKIGKAGLKNPSKFIDDFSKIRHKASFEASSTILKAPKHSKIKLAADKLAQSAEKSSRWNSYGRFVLGSIPLEASGGDQWSIFGTGLADMASQYTLGEDADLEKVYRTSERATQIGMDVLGVEAIALLADNLLLGLPKLAGAGAKYLFGKKSTGRTFISNKEGFQKVAKPELSSESARFYHNLFNGYQDQAIGDLGESLANRVVGRAFNQKSENVESLSDAVTRFVDQSGDIFTDAKSVIRNSIKEYDRQLGGSIRLSEEGIERRTKKVYDEFMDNIAENMNGFLKETSDDANFSLKIANLLTDQTPRFKGQVAYAGENGPKHLMTRAEANELASQSYRYVVKPAEAGDYARVFEIDDAVWTVDLANRIKAKNAATSTEEIIDRHAQARGIPTRKGANLTGEQRDQLEQITRNVTGVHGQEVEIDGIRGHIVDFDKNGFAIKDADGVFHEGVKIEELDHLVQQNLADTQMGKGLDDVAEGGTANVMGSKADEPMKEGMRLNEADYPLLTKQGRNLLRNLDQEGTFPAFITNNLRKIAKDNGVTIKKSDTPREVVNKIRKKGFSTSTKKILDNISKADDLVNKFKSHVNSKRILQGTDDEVFRRTGLGEKFMNHVNSFAKYANRSSSTARKFAKLLGVDSTDGIPNMVKNQTKITRWDKSKVGKDGIKTNRAFLRNTNGTDEHFINVQKVYPEDTPRVWDIDENGRLTFSEKWRRVEPNQTVKEDGTLPLYTRQEIDGEAWYRPTKEGERGVFLNVQNPTKNQKVTQKEVYANGIDAVEKRLNGERAFRLVNEGQQTVNPTKIKERPAKIYNSKSTVKKPSKKAAEDGKKEAQKEVAKNLQEAGFGQGVAFGMAGAIIDNIAGTYPEGEEAGFRPGLFTVLGAILGSKKVRTKTKGFINGFTSKTPKNIFDKSASVTQKVDSKLRQKKELESYGIFTDPDNSRAMEKAKDVVRSFKALGDKTVSKWDDFRNNGYTMSSFMFLKRLDNPIAQKLLDALERINETINRIASIPRRTFAAELKGLQVQGNLEEGAYKNLGDAYEVFSEQRGPSIVKSLGNRLASKGTEITDARAKEQFQLAFMRIKTGKARLENGELKYHSNPQTERMYKSSDVIDQESGLKQGEFYEQVDRELLNNPEFKAFLKAHETFFDNVKDQWLSMLDGRIAKRLDAIADPADRQLLQNLIKTRQSYGQWRANLSDDNARRVTKLFKSNKNVKRLIGYHNTKAKFTMLDEGYYPQMISETRSEAAFHKFVQKNGLGHKSKDKQRDAFNDHYAKVMYEMNTDKKSRRTLKKYDPEGQNYGTQYFASRSDAQNELDKISSAFIDQPEYEKLGQRIGRNKDEFIQTKQQKVYDDKGNIVLDEEGNVVTETKYFLRQPDDVGTNIFEVRDTQYKGSINHFQEFYNDLIMGNIVKSSNFLERPRVKHIPDELLEIDINNIRRRYSTDVGRRIHDGRVNMMDEDELKHNYLNPIFKEAKEQGFDKDLRDDMQDRIISIYNYAHGNMNKTGREIRKQARWKRYVDNFKNVLFGRFGYGFSWYNTFEYAVVGPHISSYDSIKGTIKLFTTNKQALRNTENLLKSFETVRREIGAVNPDFERYGSLADDQVTGFWTDKTNRVANYTADFSVAKNIGGKLFGWDVDDWGMARLNPLFGDSFLGTNFVSSAINAQAALGEARHLARLAKELEKMPQGQRITKVDGKTITYGDVKRKLGELGIGKDRYGRFLDNIDKFDEFVERTRTNEELDLRELAETEMPDHVNDVFHVMQRATESFHGTNKLYRPETWHSPIGKALSTYSTYPFNFGMQTVSRRVRHPINEWWGRYGKEQLKGSKNVNAMKMLWHLKDGKISELKSMGLTDEAIENIPVDAYRNVLKHFRTIGIGTAGYLTMDAVNDTLTYPINDATGADQWIRLKRWKTLNPGAPPSEQQTWNDIDEDMGIDNFMNILHYAMGLGARSSIFGRYGDILQQQYSLSRDGIMSVTPMTDMINGSFKRAFDITRRPVTDWPEELTESSQRFLINNTPILGSNVFGELRKGIYEQFKFKNRNDDKGFGFKAEDTGAIMTIEDLRPELE